MRKCANVPIEISKLVNVLIKQCANMSIEFYAKMWQRATTSDSYYQPCKVIKKL